MKALACVFVPALCALLALGACVRPGPEELVKSARASMAKREGNAAVVQLKDALQQRPDFAEARFLLGSALLQGGEPQAASVELRKALDLQHPPTVVVPVLAKSMLLEGQALKLIQEFGPVRLPESAAFAELLTMLSIAYGSTGQPAKADEALLAALLAVPDYPPALTQQARRAAEGKRFDDALALIGRVNAAAPKDPQGWFHRGEFLVLGKADVPGAKQAFDKALELEPEHVMARSALINLYIAQRDLKTASEHIERLRKLLPPKNPQVTLFDAQFAFASKEPKKALTHIQEVLKLAPRDARVLQLAGDIQYANGALLEAERSFTQAITLAPDVPSSRRQLARIYLRLGQLGKALNAIEPLLAEPQVDKQTYALAGEAFLLAGDLDKAGTNYRAAVALDPNNKTRTALAMSQIKAQGLDATIGELESIAAADKEIYADLALVTLLMRTRAFDRALEAVDRIEAKDPKAPTAANLRGRVLLAKGDVPEARRSFERALVIDPLFVPSAASLANLDMQDKQFDAAKKRFESVLAIDSKNLTALLAIAEIRSRMGATKEEVAGLLANAIKLNPNERAPRLMLINHHLIQQQNKLALAAAQEANTVFQNSPELLDALGRAQAAVGDLNQAVSSFTALALLQPQSADAQMRLAGAHLSADNMAAAKEALRRALVLAPNHLKAHHSLFDLAMAERRPQEAVQIARSLKAQRPNLLAGYMMEATAEVARKNVAGAANLYRAALTKFPVTEPALKLHSMLLVQKRDAAAAEFGKTWLAAHPKDSQFMLHLGEQALGRREYDAAEARFRAVLELQPTDVAALNSTAWILAKQGKPGAVAFAQRANELVKNSPILLDTLAFALAADKQLGKAIETQRAAIALAPADPVLKLSMAKLQLQNGDKAAARAELDTLSGLGDKFAGQGEVKQLLQSL